MVCVCVCIRNTSTHKNSCNRKATLTVKGKNNETKDTQI